MATTESTDRTTEPLRTQLLDSFESSAFPVCRPNDLLPVIANASAVVLADGTEVGALELVLRCGRQFSFPYLTREELVDDLVRAFGH